MAMTELTQDQQKVKALLATHPHLSVGVGNEEEMCTIAAINMALTGKVSDTLHPYVSPVIHKWVIVTQDAIPGAIRDSEAWRESIPLIAGSVASEEIERARVKRIIAWMWDALGDDAVLAFLPEDARSAWDRMLSERTTRAAYAAFVASGNSAAKYGELATRAAKAAHAAAEAARATRAAAQAAKAARADYWCRRDPARLLAELVAMA